MAIQIKAWSIKTLRLVMYRPKCRCKFGIRCVTSGAFSYNYLFLLKYAAEPAMRSIWTPGFNDFPIGLGMLPKPVQSGPNLVSNRF